MNNAESGVGPQTPAARSTDQAANEVVGVVPPGAPRWVTAELIEHTLRVWQPYYAERLTFDDALEMILNVAALGELLREKTKNE
jgi:hypothetical protein